MMTALAAALAAGAAPNPVEAIRAKDVELQKLVREKGASQKIDRIKALINGIFDFGELGKHALGSNWGKMTPDQKVRFSRSFKTWVENSSVKKLDAYVNDSTRYDAPEINEDRATVTAHVFSKGTESVVVYKLIFKQDAWKAWDLVIDDLSTAGNYGDQFREILKKNTMDGLIAKLEQKAKGDGASKSADNVKAASEKSNHAGANDSPD